MVLAVDVSRGAGGRISLEDSGRVLVGNCGP